MPDTQDSGVREDARGSRRSSRRHRRRPWLVRNWWIPPAVVFLFFTPTIWRWISTPHFHPDPLPGYISDVTTLEQEYQQYTGKPLPEGDAAQQFLRASEMMIKGSYANAAIVLEGVAKTVPVPAVFNDLGLLYAKINDGERAVQAFRNALARNHDYEAVRANLKKLRLNLAVDPSSMELEPNNSVQQANVLWLDRSMDATLDGGSGDVDYYWFTTSRPPRDRIAIQVLNKSATLLPHLLINDSNGAVVGVKEAACAGCNVRIDLNPPANTAYHLQVSANSGAGGYTIVVNALKAYDVYEPNDDIMSPTHISVGQEIVGNIMDGEDSDYFTFNVGDAAKIAVEVVPRDPALQLALTTFAADLHHTGFGPDVGVGDTLRHSFAVEPHQACYIQVWSKDKTTGAYSLIVKPADGPASDDSENNATQPKRTRKRK